jgi:hypothetical protein
MREKDSNTVEAAEALVKEEDLYVKNGVIVAISIKTALEAAS